MTKDQVDQEENPVLERLMASYTQLTRDKRVAPWLELGVFDPNDLHYLKQHIRDIPPAKHPVGNLAEKVAARFLGSKT